MRTILLPALLSFSALFFSACDASPEPRADDTAVVSPLEGTSVEGATHTVLCGCIVEGVGRCGNYVEISGQTLAIGGEVELGKMEWCGQGKQQAILAGTVVNGVFEAKSLTPVD